MPLKYSVILTALKLRELKQYILGGYNRLRQTNIVSNFVNLSIIQVSNILLVMLIFPVITRIIGLEAFGSVTFAYTFSLLSGTFINFGTNESGIRDIASNRGNTHRVGNIVYNILGIRITAFILFSVFISTLHWYHIKYYSYVLLSLPVVAAEIFNPLYFYIGTEKLRMFNIINLISNIISILSLLLFIKGPQHAVWVNFILGLSSLLAYVFLLVYAIYKNELSPKVPSGSDLLKIARHNFYITANNVSVQLQQSIMIFALAKWGSAEWLGAYSLSDKVIRSCKTLCITVSNAIYPNCVQIYHASAERWKEYRRKMKLFIGGFFFIGSILLFVLANFIIRILAKQDNQTAATFLKIMAIVPTLSAFNLINVIDQLIKKNSIYIFRIAVILLILSLLLTMAIISSEKYILFGGFTLITELSALVMYEYTIKKPALSNV